MFILTKSIQFLSLIFYSIQRRRLSNCPDKIYLQAKERFILINRSTPFFRKIIINNQYTIKTLNVHFISGLFYFILVLTQFYFLKKSFLFLNFLLFTMIFCKNAITFSLLTIKRCLRFFALFQISFRCTTMNYIRNMTFVIKYFQYLAASLIYRIRHNFASLHIAL